MNAIQKYFKYRQSLIDQYVKGDMSKKEYLDRNLDAVLALSRKPFKNVDTVEKALFNYQYYNAMAKEAKVISGGAADFELKREMADTKNYYYQKKDKATLSVLRLLDYKNVTAYFISVHAKHLNGVLFEIIIHDYEMILHSASPLILNKLKEEGVFMQEKQKSLIDGYINQKY